MVKVTDDVPFDDDDSGAAEIVSEKKKGKKKMKKSREEKETRSSKKASRKEKKAKKSTKESSEKDSKFSKLPFKQASSIIARAFVLAMAGTTINGLTNFVKKEGGNPRRVLRIFRRGQKYGKSWKVNEEKGRFQIVYKA